MPDTPHYLDVDALCAENDRDEVFTLLSNYRRRSVLYALYRNGGELAFPVLVDKVASYETGTPPDDIDDDLSQSMYISLYQTHLPKLTSFGLVEYDTDERTISLTPHADHAIVPSEELAPPQWNRYYAVFSFGGLLVGGVAWLLNGAAGLGMVSLFALTGLGGVVVAHTRSIRRCDDEGSYLSVDDLV
ncbi:DUF7344 domain-containing protein [Salinigranum halophilum]|uniref:DUF7344 domain-containing protein n=1 Tax=Salinigranum halophilum TaxID=2565931 RepID=UPI0010A8AE9C|nr:transcriptional regulator [Salinigranum halophilum]